ncbi:unnamed protein product, partial [Lymnaea stagnalis]
VSLPYRTLLVVMAVLALTWLIQGTSASAVRHQEEKIRQEIIKQAAKIIKLSMMDSDWDPINKRNGGTADAIYNLPDLLEVGRR